jgi:hypothetical protein
MSWIEDELEFREELRAGSVPMPSEQECATAVLEWWKWLGEMLKRSVEEAQQRATVISEFSEPAADTYRVSNPEAGLALNVALDEQIRAARFDYTSSGERAIAPEGGVLTLRPRVHGRIAVYYADQHLHENELMRTLLKPVLFPELPSEEAA